jgi:hypothetical protein
MEESGGAEVVRRKMARAHQTKGGSSRSDGAGRMMAKGGVAGDGRRVKASPAIFFSNKLLILEKIYFSSILMDVLFQYFTLTPLK